jgi:hypothetical protein
LSRSKATCSSTAKQHSAEFKARVAMTDGGPFACRVRIAIGPGVDPEWRVEGLEQEVEHHVPLIV